MMAQSLRIGIAGRALRGPDDEIPVALDELIYTVVAAAIEDAGLTIDGIDGVCMSASDLNDGRAISTMTLTGSTGSLRKSEMRVCNDSLAAAMLASAELAAGGARALIVCTWSKLSDASPDAIKPLGLEPAFHRDLKMNPDAIVSLRESRDGGGVAITAPHELRPTDTAVAMVLTTARHESAGPASIIGVGSAMGPYLRPEAPLLEPVRAAAIEACRCAGVTKDELDAVVVAGLQRVSDDALCEALGVSDQSLRRLAPRWGDVGYAAGLLGVNSVLQAGEPGRSLVVSAGGIGLENAYAAVMELR
jgi:hypothetical protein